MTWARIAQTKKDERAVKLPQQWLVSEDDLPGDDVTDVSGLCKSKGWLTNQELDITELGLVELAKAIANGKYTSVQVVKAFAHRATIAQQLLNPLTEINFDTALADAARMDEYLALTGQVVGPLHGVPISVKDMFHVEGLDTTIGYCSRAGQVARRDAVSVACLRKSGAVILAKTNVAQTLGFYETVNNVWGRTLNPLNRTLAPGGSSGGESALIAFRGSPFGLASDLSGSVRVPAAFCGLYALRPSRERLSYNGISDVHEGQEALTPSVGLIGQSPEDLELVCKTLLAEQPWRLDPHVVPLPWNVAQVAPPHQKLCFAIAWGDELVTPHLPIMRGLRHTASALKRAGHTVVDWQEPLRTEECVNIVAAFMSASGQDVIRDFMATCEPMIDSVAVALRFNTVSQLESWQAQRKRQILAQWFHDTWQATSKYTGTGRPIDGLIMPTLSYVARKHCAGTGEPFKPIKHSYALLPAALNLTTGAFPTGLSQDPAIDKADQTFVPRSELDEQIHAIYDDPQEWKHAPIGLQLIGQRLEEEKVIAMLGVIRDALDTEPSEV